MMGLQDLQGQMRAALLLDHAAPDGLLSTRTASRFGVYRNAYRARLCSALRDNYEVLAQVMGDEAFDALATAYIAAHPSAHYSLRWWGHLLPTFMEGQDELVEHPAMQDLARMEWALRTAFDAADAAVLTPAELAAVPPQDWARLRFDMHPSVHTLALEWAVGPVWNAVKAQQEDVPPPDAQAHTMLVWREGLRTRWKSLSDVQTRFVQGLRKGNTFGQQCERLAEHLDADDVAAAAVGVLSELLQTGALSRMHIADGNGQR